MVRRGSPELIEVLTTNGINPLPFVLSLSKDLIRRLVETQDFVSLLKASLASRFRQALPERRGFS